MDSRTMDALFASANNVVNTSANIYSAFNSGYQQQQAINNSRRNMYGMQQQQPTNSCWNNNCNYSSGYGYGYGYGYDAYPQIPTPVMPVYPTYSYTGYQTTYPMNNNYGYAGFSNPTYGGVYGSTPSPYQQPMNGNNSINPFNYPPGGLSVNSIPTASSGR